MALENFFPYRLAITSDAFSRCLTDVYQRDYGLSREEWRLLFLLARASAVSSRDLAAMTSLDKVQVSRAADRLADKGLITRETMKQDRRLKLYTCTDAGRALFEAAFTRVDRCATQILDRLTPSDRAALDRGLAALQAALQRG